MANRRHRQQTVCGWLKAANDDRDQAAATAGNTAGVVRACSTVMRERGRYLEATLNRIK